MYTSRSEKATAVYLGVVACADCHAKLMESNSPLRSLKATERGRKGGGYGSQKNGPPSYYPVGEFCRSQEWSRVDLNYCLLCLCRTEHGDSDDVGVAPFV